MKNANGDVVFEHKPENNFTYLIVSSEELVAGTYTLWSGETQLAASAGNTMGGMPGGMPGGFGGGIQIPEGVEIPEGMELPKGMEIPEGMQPPTDMEPQDGVNRTEADKIDKGFVLPEGAVKPEQGNMQRPDGGRGGQGGFGMGQNGELSTDIVIVDGGNYFSNVTATE